MENQTQTWAQRPVLFVLAGKTDLRIMGADGSAMEIDGRAIHEKLAGDVISWAMIENPCEIARRSIPEADISYPVKLYPDKTLWLARELASTGGASSIVIFNTCRDATRPHGDKEPIAVGPVLASWLGKKMGLDVATRANEIGPGKAGWINYLDGEMDLHQPGSREPNRVGLQRIENAVRLLASPGSKALLFYGGGFPDMKEPVREMIRLVFDGNCEFQQVPEGQTTVAVDSTPYLVEDSYKARQHAVAHIRRGDFQAAYAAAHHLADRPEEAGWIKPLSAAADFFAGELVDEAAASPALLELIAIERQYPFVAPALRVETSLKCGRIAEALAATFSFRDSVMGYRSRKRLANKYGLRVDDNDRIDGDIAALKLAEPQLFSPINKYDPGSVCIVQCKIWTGGRRDELWCKFGDARPNGKMETLRSKLDAVKRFRNKLTHARLDPTDIAAIKAGLAGIWCFQASPNQSPFLGGKAVIDVMNMTPTLVQHFTDLETELITLLRNHPLKP